MFVSEKLDKNNNIKHKQFNINNICCYLIKITLFFYIIFLCP